jgi:hypothetical protein
MNPLKTVEMDEVLADFKKWQLMKPAVFPITNEQRGTVEKAFEGPNKGFLNFIKKSPT